MARLPEWWEMIKIPWDFKCGETGFCLGFADYVFNVCEYESLREAFEEFEKELLYGRHEHEQSRIS